MAAEPPPLPDEQPRGLAWLSRWARQDAAPLGRREDEPPWLLPEEQGTDTVLVAESLIPRITRVFRDSAFKRVLKAIPQALAVAAVVGMMFGGVMAVVRNIDPSQFDKLLSNLGPTRLGWLAFLLLFAAQMATAIGRRRGH